MCEELISIAEIEDIYMWRGRNSGIPKGGGLQNFPFQVLASCQFLDWKKNIPIQILTTVKTYLFICHMNVSNII